MVQPAKCRDQRTVVEQPGFCGQRVHLIEREPVTEQRPGLNKLGAEHFQ